MELDCNLFSCSLKKCLKLTKFMQANLDTIDQAKNYLLFQPDTIISKNMYLKQTTSLSIALTLTFNLKRSKLQNLSYRKIRKTKLKKFCQSSQTLGSLMKMKKRKLTKENILQKKKASLPAQAAVMTTTMIGDPKLLLVFIALLLNLHLNRQQREDKPQTIKTSHLV